MHLSKEYCEDDRQISKYRAKMEWFKNEKKSTSIGEEKLSLKPSGWRYNLRGVWRGASSSQRPVLQSGFSTVVNIPNTGGAALTQRLINCETKLAKLTKYNVKIVEKSGMQLIRFFQRVHSPKSCHWDYCPVCPLNVSKGSSKCRASNVVYEAKCVECLELLNNGMLQENEVGVYIGETSRTLIERAVEHVKGANDLDVENFITKHWALRHSELNCCPRMRFRVVKQCRDALTRQVSEAIIIEDRANLNSKAEWGRNRIARLIVDKSEWSEDDVGDNTKEDLVVQAFRKDKKEDRDKNKKERKTSRPSTKKIGAKTISAIRDREEDEFDAPDTCKWKRARMCCESVKEITDAPARTSAALRPNGRNVPARTRATLRPNGHKTTNLNDDLDRRRTTLSLEEWTSSASECVSLVSRTSVMREHCSWISCSEGEPVRSGAGIEVITTSMVAHAITPVMNMGEVGLEVQQVVSMVAHRTVKTMVCEDKRRSCVNKWKSLLNGSQNGAYMKEGTGTKKRGRKKDRMSESERKKVCGVQNDIKRHLFRMVQKPSVGLPDEIISNEPSRVDIKPIGTGSDTNENHLSCVYGKIPNRCRNSQCTCTNLNPDCYRLNRDSAVRMENKRNGGDEQDLPSSSDHELRDGDKISETECQPSTSKGIVKKLKKKKSRRDPSGEKSTEEETKGTDEKQMRKKKKSKKNPLLRKVV